MKSKKIVIKTLLIAIIIALSLLAIPNTVNAEIKYTRRIMGNDGSIELTITGLNLDEGKQYEFALTLKGGKPEKWYTIANCTKNTAVINLNGSNEDIRDVLKVTDTGYIYVKVKDSTDGKYVINALEVNLKLPYLQAINYDYKGSWYSINRLYNSIGKGTYYQFKKVTDRNFIEKYLKIKNGKGDITSLESSLPAYPTNGYKQDGHFTGDEYNDGLYILWIEQVGDGTKTVHGAIIHDGLKEAKTIEEYLVNANAVKVTDIKVASPASGTYNTPQTVKINVYFSDKIKGSQVPTLKIKFGDSPERNVTNGTIKNTGYSTPCIEYSYNIQDGDNGQLQTVSLTGGNITGENEITAVLSCPVLSGSTTIKANTKGTTTNDTDNQDKTNNDKTDNDKTNNDNKGNAGSNNSQNGSNSQNDKNTGKDTTTVKGKLPQAGVNYSILGITVLILGVSVIAYLRYRKLKDIN